MRDKIRSYDDPANFDITNRPTAKELRVGLIIGFFLNAIPGAIILPLIYTWVVSEPEAGPVIILAAIGALIGMATYFPRTKKAGIRKRREFVAAGGDPTGLSDMLFGIMGGAPVGKTGWQWTFPSSDI